MNRLDYKYNSKGELKKEDVIFKRKEDEYITLSFDQSTSITGYSIFINGKLYNYGIIKANGDVNIRILQMVEVLNMLIEIYKPDKIVLEDVQAQMNARTLITLSKLLGILEYVIIQQKIDYEIVMPKVWKKTCGIKGRKRAEQKQNTKKFIEDKFGIIVTEDIADAISINYHLNN